MSAAEAPLPEIGAVSSYAIGLEQRGFLAFPLRYGTKIPATRNGFKDATDDALQVEKWFGGTDHNLGLATGRQPNGINVVVVDLDRPKQRPDGSMSADGVSTFKALCEEHGIVLDRNAPRHVTPSGGIHMFFDGGDVEYSCSSNQVAEGVDVRATGGYIGCPPSKLIDPATGLITTYSRVNGGLWGTVPIPPMPVGLGQLLMTRKQAVAESVKRHPRQPLVGDDEGPAGLIRRTFDWDAELSQDDLILVQVQGNDEHWHRVGSENHHAVTVHNREVATLWTGNLPPHMYTCARTISGGFQQVNAWEYYVGKYHDGDASAAGRQIRRERMPKVLPRPSFDGTDELTPASASVATQYCPNDWWEARQIFSHVRQAAESRSMAPQAVLVNCVARTAALVDPTYKLPPVVGGQGTLDYLAVIVAETSGGKSGAADVAAELIPAPYAARHISEQAVMMDLPIGSGEGIAQAFMRTETVVDDKGKLVKTGKQVLDEAKRGLFLAVDEGMAFVNQASRKGTTIVSTVASAWSGKQLGQLNATNETTRLIQGGKVRVSVVINMQESSGHQLMTPDLQAIGFTGRILFASAHNPSAPKWRDRPRWPGRLPWSPPPIIASGVELTYDESIIEEILELRDVVLRGGAASIDKSKSQTLLLQCKTAAIFAMWESRLHVTAEDWALARTLLDCSAETLSLLLSNKASQDVVTDHAVGAREGRRSVAAEDAAEASKRYTYRQSINEKLRSSVDGLSRKEAARSITPKWRYLFDQIEADAVALAEWVVKDGRIRLK